MVERIDSKVLVRTEDFSPTDPKFNVIGVFNPGAARHGDEIILMVRIAQAHHQDKPGWLHSPRSRKVDGKPTYEIDTLKISPDDDGDHRKPLLVNGHRRLAFISHLEMVVLDASGWNVKEIRRLDALFGSTEYEIYGVEDPRITKIDDVYYISYVGVSEQMGVATCLMTTKDFKTFERHGVIFSCENKDVVFYPEKIHGEFCCHHRPVGRINIRKVSINTAFSPDSMCWGKHVNTLHCSESGWYGGRIGAGTVYNMVPEGKAVGLGILGLFSPTAGVQLNWNGPWPVVLAESENGFPEQNCRSGPASTPRGIFGSTGKQLIRILKSG